MKADRIIDDMFTKLDQDGSMSLDCGEIERLFCNNGIHMSKEQIADMFGEAKRLDNLSEYRKNMQNGVRSKADPRNIIKKDT